MRSIVLTFGIITLCSLVLLQMGKIALLKHTLPVEAVVGASAGFFMLGGLIVAQRMGQKRTSGMVAPTPIPPTVVPFVTGADSEPVAIHTAANPVHSANGLVPYDTIQGLGISRREYEVLCELAKGGSNADIAASLFVSESTVKTHISNLLVKLDARRRTEAVLKAKALKIID